MATQFPALPLFLLLLFTFQEMIPSEAAICQAPSKSFSGLCFSQKNCSTICEKEGFIFGQCKSFKCICFKDCGNAAGGGGGGAAPPPDDQGPPDQRGDAGDGGEPSLASRKYMF